MKSKNIRAAVAAACALLQPAGELAAQAIEEIVVSTRRRAENLQEVPIAVTPISDELIQRAGIRGIDDLSRYSPSLSINESMSQNDLRITVRGLTNTRGRANVAFLVDGVDITSETTGTNAGSPLLINQRLLNDIERVEIVRGPQSALYGRAAFAGAISYVTKEPGAEWEGQMGLELAEEGAYEASGALSIPILGEVLAARLNGVAWTEDGFYTNAVSGESTGGGDGYGMAGTLLYRPTEDIKIKARATWSDDEYGIRSVARLRGTDTLPIPQDAIDAGVLAPNTAAVSVLREIGDADGLEVRASEDPLTGGEYPGNRLEVFRGTLLADWQLGDYTLSSNTGITDADLRQRYDLDHQAEGRPDQIFAQNDVDTIDETDQFSQELRLASRWDGPFQATIGGLYWTEDRTSRNRNLIVVCSDLPSCYNDGYASWQSIYLDLTALDGGVRIPTVGDTDHWSLYATAEWQVTETVKLAVEDRYVQERFYAELPIGSTCSNFYPFAGPDMTLPVNTDPDDPFFNFGCRVDVEGIESGAVRTSYQTPKVTVEWKAATDVMLYASAGKGEKPGGISLLTIAAPIPQPFDSFKFDPEKMWSYEVGTKTSWSGDFGAVVFNVAGFYQDYSDKQVGTVRVDPVIGFPVAVVANASSAHVLGSEIEASWATPIEGLTLTAAYTWLDTEYDDYREPTRSATAIALQGFCGEVTTDELGSSYCTVDYSGKQLEFAPEHALVTGAAYRRPLGGSGVDLLIETDVRFQDEVFTNVSNYTTQDAYWLLDLRAGLKGGKWQFLAFLNNVFDDDTIRSSGGAPDFGAVAVGTGAPTSPQFQTNASLPDPRVFGMRLSYSF